MYRLLPDSTVFPHPLNADPSGVVMVGGDLSSERLVCAYDHGIFPWYSESEPILWWFPDPRCVLLPEDLHVSRSLNSILRSGSFEVTFDHSFAEVIRSCRTIERKGQDGTWITEEMHSAYIALHRQGVAHSVEVWADGQLVGGLYGVARGKIFFGESMFSRVSNASKVALVHLVELLKRQGYLLIDCQQDTPHLRSLGAHLIPAEQFHELLQHNRLAILKGAGVQFNC